MEIRKANFVLGININSIRHHQFPLFPSAPTHTYALKKNSYFTYRQLDSSSVKVFLTLEKDVRRRKTRWTPTKHH